MEWNGIIIHFIYIYKYIYIYFWLVVLTIWKNDGVKVSWDDYSIPN